VNFLVRAYCQTIRSFDDGRNGIGNGLIKRIQISRSSRFNDRSIFKNRTSVGSNSRLLSKGRRRVRFHASTIR